MSLARIKQQAEQADQFIRELGQPTVDEVVQEQEEESSSAPVESVEADQGVAVEAEQMEESLPDVDKLRKEAETWEQRYRSLDGMIRARDKQIQQLHELVAGMQQAVPRQAQDTSEDSSPLLTKKDEDDFGSELVDMARRAAREEFRSLKSDILSEIAAIRNNLQGVSEVTQLTANDRFEMKLDDATNKQWRELDSDQSFIDWLKASNARLQVFTTAVQGQDATTVAEFFNEYAEMANQQRAQEAVPKQTRKAEIEKQVSPGKSKSLGTPDSQASGKKMWTRTEIAQAYANKKQYKADEFQQMERDIATAQREGRVNYAA